ncbi:MAG: BrnA antitoxin family protein [Pirellulales bacterium]|nr:BrnA antitoxin family protein [Pirellulales bacterium]
MMREELPKTDSIKELSSFWEKHDLTDFDDQLEEVTESIFEKSKKNGTILQVPLTLEQSNALEALAQSYGIDSTSLIQQWVQENILPSS